MIKSDIKSLVSDVNSEEHLLTFMGVLEHNTESKGDYCLRNWKSGLCIMYFYDNKGARHLKRISYDKK